MHATVNERPTASQTGGSGVIGIAHNDINAMVAKVFGAVFVLIGLLGFVMNPILGLFGVNALHNIIHLLSGIVLLAAGFANHGAYARVTNQIFGVVYLLVTILGFLRIEAFINLLGMDAQGAPVTADNVLHLLLAVVFLAVGFGVRSHTTTARRA